MHTQVHIVDHMAVTVSGILMPGKKRIDQKGGETGNYQVNMDDSLRMRIPK